jgi:hypothetical protein
MDYDALAKKYGGSDVAPAINYDALAKQYGGADTPAPPYFEISGVGSTGVPGPRRAPGLATQFGRTAASLADVTLGGILPGAAQYLAYPLARLQRSPDEAQAITQNLVGAIDKPFGKAFGVTETPEYQQEAGRQLMDFIGQNFQKGAKFIAEKTGIPAADVESYMATLSLTAPKVVPPVAKAVTEAVAPVVQDIRAGVQLPFEPMLQRGRERRSAESYARAPELDAIAEAQRLKLVIDPRKIDPSSVMARGYSLAAGPRGPEAMVTTNKPRVTQIAKDELGLDATTSLTSAAPFKQARANVAAPYEEVKKLPIQQADAAMIQRLEAIRSDLEVIGAKEYAPAISKIVDDAISKTQTGLTGETLLKNISVLRERAKKTYNNKSATTEAIDIADTNLKIAAELESMIDGSIANPKLLEQYRDARQKMARTYAYESATDFNTGTVDVAKLARITSKDNALTGDIASLGRIAGNFPEAFAPSPESKFFSVPRLTRAGISGTAGALIGGAAFDTPGYILGTAAGSLLGEVSGKYAAKRLASPSYQAGLQLQDFRIPVNQLAAAAAPIPQSQAVVPFDPRNALVQPTDIVGYAQDGSPITAAQAFSRPNFTMPRQGPEVRAGVQPTPPQLAAPSPEGTINALRAEDVRRAGMSRTLGQQAEAQQAAAEAAARRPARGGENLVFDAAGNLVPETPAGQANIIGAPTSLESAVQKLSGQVIEQPSTTYKTMTISPKTGAQPYTRIIKKEGETTFERGVPRAFDLTATEKIAWDKARVDLAEVAPGFKSLTDKAIAQKMMDRAWIQDTITKAREKAAMFDDISKRVAGEQAKRDAAIKRDQMLDVLAALEERLSAPRPVSSGIQGPKTRAAKRNALAPDNQNNLAP